MTEAPSLPYRERTPARTYPRKQDAAAIRREVLVRGAAVLREARRSRNRQRGDLVAEGRCECARPDCRLTFPAVAEAYRRSPDRFIVSPEHAAGETVIAAADRFFVVEGPREPSH